MQSVSNLALRELGGVTDGRNLRAPRRREYRDRDNQIRDAQERLRTGRITVGEFITLVANYFIPMVQVQIVMEDDAAFPVVSQNKVCSNFNYKLINCFVELDESAKYKE